jgi:hypothetical protein
MPRERGGGSSSSQALAGLGLRTSTSVVARDAIGLNIAAGN